MVRGSNSSEWKWAFIMHRISQQASMRSQRVGWKGQMWSQLWSSYPDWDQQRVAPTNGAQNTNLYTDLWHLNARWSHSTVTVNTYVYTCNEEGNKTWHFSTNEDKCGSSAGRRSNKLGNTPLFLLHVSDFNCPKGRCWSEWGMTHEFCNWSNLSKIFFKV